MGFKEIVSELGEALGMELPIVGDTTAVRLGAGDNTSVVLRLQGFDERGALLATADLGEPPPEHLEKLLRALLEANDLYRDTGGATLSLDPATGHIRLQRFDAYEAWGEVGGAKALGAFAQYAAAWAGIVRDFRDAPGGEGEADAAGVPPPERFGEPFRDSRVNKAKRSPRKLSYGQTINFQTVQRTKGKQNARSTQRRRERLASQPRRPAGKRGGQARQSRKPQF